MKSQLPLSLNQRVKMSLIQPAIKCSGRKTVSCFYKGTVIEIFNQFALIEFKVYGKKVRAIYEMMSGCFLEKEFKDIKIIK